MRPSKDDIAKFCEITDVVVDYNNHSERQDKITVTFGTTITIEVNGVRYFFPYIYAEDALEFTKKVCELAIDRGNRVYSIDRIVTSMMMQVDAEQLVEMEREVFIKTIDMIRERLVKYVPNLKVPEGNYEKDDF